MLSDDLNAAAHAMRLCASAPAADMRNVVLSAGELLERASEEAAHLEAKCSLLPPKDGVWGSLRRATFAVAIGIQQRAIRLGSAVRRTQPPELRA